jgi:hypothetical protein
MNIIKKKIQIYLNWIIAGAILVAVAVTLSAGYLYWNTQQKQLSNLRTAVKAYISAVDTTETRLDELRETNSSFSAGVANEERVVNDIERFQQSYNELKQTHDTLTQTIEDTARADLKEYIQTVNRYTEVSFQEYTDINTFLTSAHAYHTVGKDLEQDTGTTGNLDLDTEAGALAFASLLGDSSDMLAEEYKKLENDPYYGGYAAAQSAFYSLFGLFDEIAVAKEQNQSDDEIEAMVAQNAEEIGTEPVDTRAIDTSHYLALRKRSVSRTSEMNTALNALTQADAKLIQKERLNDTAITATVSKQVLFDSDEMPFIDPVLF